MSKKTFLAIGALALIAAALVAPSGASATMLYYEGKAIEKAVPFEATGTLEVIASNGNGIDCKTTMNVDAETWDAKVTGITILTNTCVGTGAYALCTVTSHTATNLPWTAHLDLTGFTITDFTIDYNLNCLMSAAATFEKVTATADNAAAIKKLTLSGTGLLGGTAAEIRGVFEIDPTHSGKLKIAE